MDVKTRIACLISSAILFSVACLASSSGTSQVGYDDGGDRTDSASPRRDGGYQVTNTHVVDHDITLPKSYVARTDPGSEEHPQHFERSRPDLNLTENSNNASVWDIRSPELTPDPYDSTRDSPERFPFLTLRNPSLFQETGLKSDGDLENLENDTNTLSQMDSMVGPNTDEPDRDFRPLLFRSSNWIGDLMESGSSMDEVRYPEIRNVSTPNRSARLPVVIPTSRTPNLSRSRYASSTMTDEEVDNILSGMRISRAGVLYPDNMKNVKKCTTSSGKNGECVILTQCQEAMKKLKTSFPTICRWEGDMPIVCCATSQQSTQTLSRQLQVPGCGRRSLPNDGLRRSVRQVARSVPPGFTPNPKLVSSEDRTPIIAGGIESQPGVWPWMAGIYTRNLGRENFLCGGAIVTDKYIVTAAHCFGSNRGRQPVRYVVRVGSIVVREGTMHTIENITVHPQYRALEHYNDLAVIRLREPIRFTNNARPICLPDFDDRRDLVNRDVTVIGWGDQDFGGRSSKVLREVTVKVVPNEECDEAYTPISGRNIPQGITNQFICAGVAEGGKDACQRDSGGPLMLPEDGTWVLVGIVSFGFQCAQAGYPGVYTRASNFIGWLEQVTDIADASRS